MMIMMGGCAALPWRSVLSRLPTPTDVRGVGSPPSLLLSGMKRLKQQKGPRELQQLGVSGAAQIRVRVLRW